MFLNNNHNERLTTMLSIYSWNRYTIQVMGSERAAHEANTTAHRSQTQ